MPQFELIPGLFLAPTPAGAYYAASSPEQTPLRQTLLTLMSADATPALTLENLLALTDQEENEALSTLHELQSQHLVQGLGAARSLPKGTLEKVLPEILAELAGRNKALLADEQGFYLASHGFSHELAEELAGLSADLGNLHERHQRLISGGLSLQTSAWAMISAGGNSEIGFWPLYIGPQRFVLILTGLPNLNQTATLDLIWTLVRRYGR